MLMREFDSCQPALSTTSAANGSVNANTLASLIGDEEIARYPKSTIKRTNRHNCVKDIPA